MGRLSKILIGLVGVGLLAAVIGTAAVFADTPTPTPNAKTTVYDQFVSKLADALHLNKTDVQTAISNAEKSMIDDALKAGKITQQQADQAKQRIDQGGSVIPPMMGRTPFGPQGKGPMGKGPAGGMMGLRVAAGFELKSVADFLGITPTALMQELRGGKSLAQVAQEHGKSRDDLKNNIVSTATTRLDQAVKNGKLTADQEKTMLQKLQSNLDQIIDRTFQGQPGGPGSRPFNHPNKPNNQNQSQNQSKS